MMKIFCKTLFLIIGIITFTACDSNDDPQNDDFGSNQFATKEGYIVGGIKKSRDEVLTRDDIVFGTSGTNPDLLLVAKNIEEKDFQECFVVDLSESNLGIYKGLNLTDNPANLHKKIQLHGFLSDDVYGMNGMKGISEAFLEDKKIELLDEVNPFGLPTAMKAMEEMFCDFEGIKTLKDLPNWTQKNFINSTEWTIQTGNNNTTSAVTLQDAGKDGNMVDSWLITPLLDVKKDSKLYFDCQTEIYSSLILLNIVFIEVTDQKTICTEIPVAEIPAISNGKNENIKVDLSQFANKVGFIGFKASGSSDKRECTYRVDNIRFTNKIKTLFLESFGTIPVEQHISVNNYAEYDNKDVFRSVKNNADIRYVKDGDYWNSNVLYCVLGYQGVPYSDEIIMDVSRILPQEGYKNLELSFDAGTGYDFYGTSLNKIMIKCDGIPVEVDSSLTLASIVFKNFSFKLPSNSVKEISFSYTENKNVNIAIDNIKITGEEIK